MDLAPIYVGIVVGTLSRLTLLKVDYRNYPSAPNGVLIHMTIGALAASMGSVAVMALITKQWVAVTFLALAIQQFREVRKSEAASLEALENAEPVPRGGAYISGIAKSFEARNYVALLVGLTTTAFAVAFRSSTGWWSLLIGTLGGAAVLVTLDKLVKDKRVTDIAKVRPATLRFEGYKLYVDDVYVSNVGLPLHRERIGKEGIAIMIDTRSYAGHITLANYGQRLAIMHEVARLMGIKRYHGMRRDFNTGSVAMYLIPLKGDVNTFVSIVENVPLLESIRRSKDVRGPGNANLNQGQSGTGSTDGGGQNAE